MTTITCCRCRHAQLEKDTDFSTPLPMVFCGKENCRRPVCLSGCGLADPAPVRIRYRGANARIRENVGGDRLRNATPVELAYLRHAYAADYPMHRMVAATGRTAPSVSTLARNHGFHRPRRHLMGSGDSQRARAFTAQQTRYLLSVQGTDAWPRHNDRWRPQNKVLRAAVLARVAELGPRHSWTVICKHCTLQSPAYRRKRWPADKARAGEFAAGHRPARWEKP